MSLDDTTRFCSPAARAVWTYWQAGGVCPSPETGLAECVTSDAMFFADLINIYEASQEAVAPVWAVAPPRARKVY